MKSIFVSSTFRDFQYERDALHHEVLPFLNDLARQYGESVSFCDLRWGVDTSKMSEAEQNRQVLSVCMDEIDRSRPYMIVLLGDRYGYVPDQRIMNREIRKRRLSELENLRISVTQLEIEYGALQKEKDLEHTYFYIRSLRGDAPEDYRESDPDYEEKLRKLKERIQSLAKGHIRFYEAKWDHGLHDLSSFTKAVTEDLKRELQKDFEAQLQADPMERELSAQRRRLDDLSEVFMRSAHTPSFAEKASMKLMANLVPKKFRHKENFDFDALTEIYYSSPANIPVAPFIVRRISRSESGKEVSIYSGERGWGKTVMIVYIMRIMEHLGWNVLPVFCGTTKRSSDAEGVLDIFIYQLEKLTSLPHVTCDREHKVQRLSDLISYYENHEEIHQWKRLLFVADGIDRLAPDRFRDDICFLPARISEAVHILGTVSDDFEFPVSVCIVPVERIAPLDKYALIGNIQNARSRHLAEDVIRELIQTHPEAGALYLDFAMKRLMMMDLDDFTLIRERGDGMSQISLRHKELIRSFPDQTGDMAYELLETAAKQLNQESLITAAKLIALTSGGLRAQDIEAIFASYRMPFSYLSFVQYVNYISELFLIREDGRYDFLHESVREGLLCNTENPDALRDMLYEHIQTLDPSDPVRMNELPSFIYRNGDSAGLLKMICEIPEDAHAAVSQIAVRNREEGGELLAAALEECEPSDFGKEQCSAAVHLILERLLPSYTDSRDNLKIKMRVNEGCIVFARRSGMNELLLKSLYEAMKTDEKYGSLNSLNHALKCAEEADETAAGMEGKHEHTVLIFMAYALSARMMKKHGGYDRRMIAKDYAEKCMKAFDHIEHSEPAYPYLKAMAARTEVSCLCDLSVHGLAERYEKIRSALNDLEELVSKDPLPEYQQAMIEMKNRLSDLCFDFGDQKHITEGKNLAHQAVFQTNDYAQNTFSIEPLGMMSEAYENMGDLYLQEGNTASRIRALEQYEKAGTAAETLHQYYGTIPYGLQYALILHSCGTGFTKSGNYRESAAFYEKELNILEQLRTQDRFPDEERQILSAQNSLAETYTGLGNEYLGKAARLLEKSIGILEPAEKRDSYVWQIRMLGTTLSRYAFVLQTMGGTDNLNKALSYSGRGLKRARFIAKDNPSSSNLRILAVTLEWHALLLKDLRRYKEADSLLQEAEETALKGTGGRVTQEILRLRNHRKELRTLF